jgi:hypothetical protein
MLKNSATSLFLGPLLFVSSLAWNPSSSAEEVEAKPFKRAFVMAGGGLDWPRYMGINETLIQEGMAPDLYVGICGGSFSAAYAALGSKSWIEDTYRISNIMRLKNKSLLPLMGFFLNLGEWNREGRLASFANKAIFENLEEGLEASELKVPFNALKIPTLIISTRLLYDPYNVPKERVREAVLHPVHRNGPRTSYRYVNKNITLKGKKLYQIVFFTDAQTAKLLPRKLRSLVSQLYPDAPFVDEILVKTDVLVSQAIRASIADPVLMSPAFIDGHYYVTGSPEHQPETLLNRFSETVVETDRGLMTARIDAGFRSVFGFSLNDLKTRKRVTDKALIINIEQNQEWEDYSFTPKVKKGLFLESSIPENFEEFETKVLKLKNFGAQQTQKAISRTRTRNE